MTAHGVRTQLYYPRWTFCCLSRLRQNKRPSMQLEIHGDGVVKIRRIATGAGAPRFVCAAEITGVSDLHVHVSSEGSRNSAAKIIAVIRRDTGDTGVDSSIVREAKIKI